MKIVDANVLLYAVNRKSAHHAAARTWLDRALGGSEAVGFAWSVILAFVRLSTNPAVFPRPFSSHQAIETVATWLAQPGGVVVHPTSRHLSLMGGLLDSVGTAGNLVNDAHLASLALEHDADIVSFDTDFARFAGVRWLPPPSA